MPAGNGCEILKILVYCATKHGGLLWWEICTAIPHVPQYSVAFLEASFAPCRCLLANDQISTPACAEFFVPVYVFLSHQVILLNDKIFIA